MTTKKHDDDKSKVLGVRLSDKQLMHFHALLMHEGNYISSKSQIVKTILTQWYEEHNGNVLNLPITQATLNVCKPKSSKVSILMNTMNDKEVTVLGWLELIPSADRGKCKMVYQNTMSENANDTQGLNKIDQALDIIDPDDKHAVEISRLMKMLIHIGAYKGTKYEDYINTLSADEISIEGMNITKESEISEDIIPQDIRDNTNDGIPEGMIIAVDESEED